MPLTSEEALAKRACRMAEFSRLDQERAASNLTRAAWSRASGISKPSLTQYARGLYAPTEKALDALRRALPSPNLTPESPSSISIAIASAEGLRRLFVHYALTALQTLIERRGH